MIADPLLTALAAAVPDLPVARVVVGLNWTLVQAADGGGTGLAHSPPRGSPGCRALDRAGGLVGLGLRALAAMVASDSPLEVALGIAAVNAGLGRDRPAPGGGNGLDLFRPVAERTMVAGRFPGLDARLPGCRVVEREPGPGDHAEAEAGALLEDAAALVITASALANGGVSRYLALAAGRPGPVVALVGPGTPLAPCLHAAGIAVLAGSIVTDPESAARVVMEGGALQALRPLLQGSISLADGFATPWVRTVPIPE